MTTAKTTIELTDTDHLSAEEWYDAWLVRDERGGVWHPDEITQAEIQASDDPADRAIEICTTEPMRGAWHA